MEADTYQNLANRTLINKPDSTYSDEEIMLVWCCLGLAGESGEVVDIVKKSVFHRHDMNKDALVKELGDVLWYVAGICKILNVQLSDVMEININKILDRYPDGYSSEASKSRNPD